MFRKKGLKHLSLLLAACIFFAVLLPAAVFAVGSYGVDLDSDAYAVGTNPFAQWSWGQCTWYAWGRAYERTGERLPCRGNAGTWLRSCGDYPSDSVPSPDSVIVWDYGEYGHVAYVEAVSGNKLYISHGNIQGHTYTEGVYDLSTGIYTDSMGLGLWILDSDPAGYIHLVWELESVLAFGGENLKEGEDYTFEGRVITVNCGIPCIAGYLGPGGDYVSIPAVPGEDGSYTFTAPMGVKEAVLVVKGDANLDGKISNADSTRIKAHVKGQHILGALQLLAADANGDGGVTNADSTKIKAAIKGSGSIEW